MRFSIFAKFLLGLFVCLLAFLAVNVLSYGAVESASRGLLHEAADTVPKKKAALVPGCAKTLANGRENRYFHYRIDAAASLYHAGKCDYLIVSGDNSRKDYDEPTDMQNALIKRGVPKNRIYRDFAGFRTLDSVVRAKEIFGQEDIIVVSQPFHNKRALFIAKKSGMKAVALNCREVRHHAGLKTRVREYPARVKMMLDLYIFDTAPKYSGRSFTLGEPPPEHGS